MFPRCEFANCSDFILCLEGKPGREATTGETRLDTARGLGIGERHKVFFVPGGHVFHRLMVMVGGFESWSECEFVFQFFFCSILFRREEREDSFHGFASLCRIGVCLIRVAI
jgi:hypothetical protein